MILTLVLGACASGGEPLTDGTPPPASTPQSQEPADDIAEAFPVNIRLDRIQLNGETPTELDAIMLVPLNAATGSMNFQAEYYLDETAIITATTPYEHVSPWSISFDRNQIEGDIGLWVMILSESGSPDLVREFVGFVEDSIPFFASSALTVLLGSNPETMPAGAIAAEDAVERGLSLLGRVGSISADIGQFVDRMFTETELPQNLLALGSSRVTAILQNASDSAARLDYFGEVLIVLDDAQNYYIDNRIQATTTDGRLIIELTIYDDPTRPPVGDVVQTFDSTCNATFNGTLQAGNPATVLTQTLSVYASTSTLAPRITARLMQGDTLTPVYPVCDFDAEALWWYVSYDTDSFGWVQEFNQNTRFVEAAQ